MDKKLFLLDAYALIYRAYYAFMRAPRVTSSGMNTSAIFGFVNTLEDLLKKENPDYIAVCFDPAHGRTFRHDEYPQYKAGRDKQPEDITLAIPYIKSILEAYRIPVIEIPGYEADDVIGTISKVAEREGLTTFMMTPDKDYGQLVTDHVFMYRPALKGQGFEVRGPKQVAERYGISSPSQVIDLLALEGDASDNVPGCPGVGEKTAAKLIAEFGSVENLLENTDKIKGALQKKISDNAELIRLSKHLVTIVTDVPVNFGIEDLKRHEPDVDALTDIFKELEFRSFVTKYKPDGGNTNPVAPSATPVREVFNDVVPKQSDGMASLFDFVDDSPAITPPPATLEQRIITDPGEIEIFLSRAASAAEIALCVDAVGNEAMTAQLNGFAFAFKGSAADSELCAYIPWPDDQERRKKIVETFVKIFSDPGINIVADDIKRCMLLLRRINVCFNGVSYFDTAVAHYLCQPEQKHDTTTLAMTFLGFDLDQNNTPCSRADIVLRLKPIIEAEVERRGQTKLLNDIELPLVEVLADMEWQGVCIDTAELQKLSHTLSERLAELETKAFSIVGRKFNIASPSQVGQILFDEMKIDPKAKKTKGGAWSTAEDVLEKYAATVPLVRIILDIRALRKLLATYVDALPKLINPATGKIHTTYNQTVTATGRISSANPNLQNIPIRTADGRDIRRAFIPDKGRLMLSADYSQIELRLMAMMSGDKDMIAAFLSGEDIHRATAAKIYHIDPKDVTDDQRRNAKTANFGIIYGISAFGLSERLGIPRTEAKELIEGYLRTYPMVAQYMTHAIEQARIDGFVSTIMGRKRYLPDINSRSNTVRAYAERNAINAPLQGSAADIIKIAMVRIFKELKNRGLKSKMIMQVHDELIFVVEPNELAEIQQIVTNGMENALNVGRNTLRATFTPSTRVPLMVEAGVGANWLEAH